MPRENLWPRVVIFDLDGTLVDTALDLTVALNIMLGEIGLPPHPPQRVRRMIGGGLETLLDRALAAHGAVLDGERRKWAGARLLKLYAAEPMDRSKLYPGAAELLQRLSANGVACGLCTNKPEVISGRILRDLGVIEAFGCIQCGDGGLPKKPHPAGLRRVLQSLGAEPNAAVMVGDSNTDVEAARAAHLAGIILVSHGYSTTPVEELGADVIIDELGELMERLGSLAQATESRI
jgi:phosphoglycolate phosphatase